MRLTHSLAVLLLALVLGAGMAQDDADSIHFVDDFTGGAPAERDAFGNPIGFVTWQDGGGNLELSTVTVEPGTDLALPEQDETIEVFRVLHEINQWGGFTHAFTDDSVSVWQSRDWSAYAGMRFWYKGDGRGGTVQVDLFDNRNPDADGDTAERFFYRFPDDTTAWRVVEIPFADFRRRTDFQPGGAPDDGLTLSQVWGYALGFPPGDGVSHLANVTLYGRAGDVAEGTVTVQFLDPAVDLPEGGVATLRVGLSEPSDEPVSVRVFVQAGTAESLRDLVNVSQLVVFAPGETEATVTVTSLDDSKHEGDEDAVAVLDSPLNAAIGFQKRATLFLRDDDALVPGLLADFDGGTERLAADGAEIRRVELLEGTPNARPAQDRFEAALRVDWDASATLRSHWAQARDWSDSEAFRFWYRGDGSGRPVTVEILDDRDADRAWTLVWSDEFDAPAGTGPDPAIWKAEIGDGTNNGIPGWGNAERQSYTDDPRNVAHDGEGNLVITVLDTGGDAETCYYGSPCEFTSARLITQDRVEFAYGRVEARIEIPFGQGLWSAFWLLGDDVADVGWPQTGEIDIMENIGREPSTVHGTIHGPGYSGAEGIGAPYRLPANERFADGFHTYGIEWEPGEIRWYVDGQHFNTLTPDDLPRNTEWVYDHPFFLLMNVAVGGYWPGYPDETTTFPQTMTVDYVRLYQAPDTSERYTSTFRDSVDGWVEVTLPFTTFVRSDEQPQGAPRNGFGRSAVWGWTLSLPDGGGQVWLDRVEVVDEDD